MQNQELLRMNENDKTPPKSTSPQRARQGREGFPVLVILITALALLAIGWVAVEIYGMSIDESQPVETRQSSDVPPEGGGAPGTVESEAAEE